MDSITVNAKCGMKEVTPGWRVMEIASSSKQVLQALTNRESVPEEVYCDEVRQETVNWLKILKIVSKPTRDCNLVYSSEDLKGATGPQEGYHSTTSRY